jgi:ubiquinone biosynthesis protein COQ9
MAHDGERETGQEGDLQAMKAALVAAALQHVVFDGWTARTLVEAARDADIPPDRARLAFPRGGVDLALGFHIQRDAALAHDLAEADLGGMRFRDKIAHAVMRRLELAAGDREAVRRGAALFALPHHAPDAARAIWHTADTIWNALGDTSRDFNWYSKRTTLSAVYSSAVLYWLGDETPGFSATREFVQRRIDNVMRFEEARAKLRKNPVASALMRGPQRLLDRVRAPANTAPPDLPGSWTENP